MSNDSHKMLNINIMQAGNKYKLKDVAMRGMTFVLL